MNDELDLASVHWSNGMTLTEDVFLRQERYFDSAILWMLRFTTAAFGLVGSGPRLNEGQLRPDPYDPQIDLIEESGGIAIAVRAVRGITVGGGIVDLASDVAGEPAEIRIPLQEIEDGDTVYVAAPPHSKVAYLIEAADYDGQSAAERRQRYDVTINPAQEQLPWCLAVGRLRKSGAKVSLDPNYIPPCAFLGGHSGLTLYAEKILRRVKALADGFQELHRAMRDTLKTAQGAGMIGELGLDEVTFVGRMTIALQECLYDASESLLPPHKFLGQFRRLLHLAYTMVSLSARVREHFQEVVEKLQQDYLAPLENSVDRLVATRQSRINADLSDELQSTEEALHELGRIYEGMRAKYIDFRVNSSVSSIDHFFDGGIVYRLIKSQQAAQSTAGEVSASFRNLSLSGERVNYRILLAGDPQIATSYSEVAIDVSINDINFRGAPQRLSCVPRQRGQCNFEFDFKAPQGQTITDLTVRYSSQCTFRAVMLFEEIRLGIAHTEEAPRPIRPEPAPLNQSGPQSTPQPPPSVRPRIPGQRISAFDVQGPRRPATQNPEPRPAPPRSGRFD